jgi:hypothetical protein
MDTQNARFLDLWQAALKKKDKDADEARLQHKREQWAAKVEEKRLERLNSRRREEAAKDAPLAAVELGLFGNLSIEV